MRRRFSAIGAAEGTKPAYRPRVSKGAGFFADGFLCGEAALVPPQLAVVKITTADFLCFRAGRLIMSLSKAWRSGYI